MSGRACRAGWWRIPAALVVATVVLGAWALPAGAAAARGLSTDDCDALQSIGDDIGLGQITDLYGKQAKRVARALRNTASEVDDRKVARALRTMAAIHAALGRSGNALSAAKVAIDKGKAYAKAFSVFASSQSDCAQAAITVPPNVTVPNVTLPGGVTLPSLPR